MSIDGLSGTGDRLFGGSGHGLSDRELLEFYLGDRRKAFTTADLGCGWLRGRLPIEMARRLGEDAGVRLMALRELRVRWLHMAIDPRRPLRQTSTLAQYLDARHAQLDQEVAGAVLLDDTGALVDDVLLYRGFYRRIRVRVKVILGAVLGRGLNRFVFFHTHPSPSPIPSEEDFRFHQRLVESCELTGVEVVDDLIIGAGGAYQSVFRAEKRDWPESVMRVRGWSRKDHRSWWTMPVN